MFRSNPLQLLRAKSLAERLAGINKYQFSGSVKQCGTRLMYHIAKQDPQLALLPAAALVSTVNETLSTVSQKVDKKTLTQPMIREILARTNEPLRWVKPDLDRFSEKNDRNISFMVANRKRLQLLNEEDDDIESDNITNKKKTASTSRNKKSKQQKSASQIKKDRHDALDDLENIALDNDLAIGKFGCFYDLMTRNSELCKSVRPLEKRICIMFHLIAANGYQESYDEEQTKKAVAKVNSKTKRYLNTFKYDRNREFYCRRRLLTDGSLHNIISSGEPHDVRKVAWILFFDSTFQRFPRRPKKDPSHDLYELWHEWSNNPVARSLPFIERFVALLTHPDLNKMLKEAALTTDAKARAQVDKHTSLFEYRRRTAVNLGVEPYNARKEIQRQGYTLNQLAWKLQIQRDRSPQLSSLPTYFSVMETSKKYRSNSCVKLIERALLDASDEKFSYEQTEL